MRAVDREAREIADRATAEAERERRELTRDAPICDFCAKSCPNLSTTTTFQLTAVLAGGHSFITEKLGAATIPFAYDPLWLACDECTPIVKMGNPVALVEHVLKSPYGIVGRLTDEDRREVEPVVRSDLLALYQAFYEASPRIRGC